MLRDLSMIFFTCQMLRAPFQDVCCVQTSTHPHCSWVFCLLQLYIQQGEEFGCCWNISTVCLQDYPRCRGSYKSPLAFVIVKCNHKRLFVICPILSSFQSTSKADKSSGMSRHHTHSVNLTIKEWYNFLTKCICGPTSLFPPPPTDSKSRKEKLEQVASFSLFGNIMSMASVQLVGASRDALLLSFKDAKVSMLSSWIFNSLKSSAAHLRMCSFSHQLSVVEYDPGTHDLKTLSLHYFEEPELRVCTVENKS